MHKAWTSLAMQSGANPFAAIVRAVSEIVFAPAPMQGQRLDVADRMALLDGMSATTCSEASQGGCVFDQRPFLALKCHRVSLSEAIVPAVNREPAAPNRSVT